MSNTVFFSNYLHYNFFSGGDEGNQAKIGAIDVSSIQAEPGKGCPRCGGKVFAAEEIHVRNKVSYS